MKISYNWLKQFIDTNKTPDELSLILTNIGLEVESLEKEPAVAGGLEGLVVGEVKTCVQHPNADRLRVTTVNIGGAEDLHIVCGAPNVAQGQKVVVAPVGTTVYPLSGEPFKITKSKIRGEVSEGMICAEDEIGLGTSHDGIIVLPAATQVGILAKDHFQLNDDHVFEIGLTPNRADAASHLGVARDLAAYLRTDVQMPDSSAFSTDSEQLVIPVAVEDKYACPRYSSVTISGVKIGPSPQWLQDRLKVIGLRPINNVVDITNYVLHGLGQPLHAFDADKISGGKVVVKTYPAGTLFTTLDDVERKLDAEDLMIGDANGPMCLAGVFGGKTSGVTDETVNVFLESAYFNAVSVRKTSKRHGLKTDASFRFERGTDPDMTVTALKYAAIMIKEIAGGTISSGISDIYPDPVAPFRVEASYNGINRLIGTTIAEEEIRSIITSLGIKISGEADGTMHLLVPPYKVDVTRECDVTEEVLRIYGYNNIAIPGKVNASLSNTVRPDKENTQHTIADMLTANGFAEIWCNSLTKPAYATAPGEVVNLLNPLSTELSIMRQALLHPALESVAYNQNRKNADLKFYEFGKTYHLINDAYEERPRLLLLLSGAKQSEQWNHTSKPVSFYDLKAAVDAVLLRLGLKNFQSEQISNDQFSFGLTYFRGPQVFVQFGAVTAADKKKTGVDRDVFYADFDWKLLLEASAKTKVVNKEVPKFPSVRRDLSMLVDKSVSFEALKAVVFKTDKKLIKAVNIFDVYEGGGKAALPEGKKSYALNFTLQDEDQTLTDKQIDAVMQKIIHNLAQNVNAEIRK